MIAILSISILLAFAKENTWDRMTVLLISMVVVGVLEKIRMELRDIAETIREKKA